jgi:PAS domain S-box-containing protein
VHRSDLLTTVDDVFRTLVEQADEFSIILLDGDGHIAFWNSGAAAIFGYPYQDVVGKHFRLLFVPEDVELEIPEKELRIASGQGRADDTRWHMRQDGDLVFIDGITHPIRNQNGDIVGFSKFGRDVTERYLSEKRVAAQLALMNLLDPEVPFETIARRIMQTICENLRWEIGGLWTVRGDTIECIDFWHSPDIDSDAARKLCLEQRCESGVGLPGEVWESGRALWVPMFSDAERYSRVPLAAGAGMRTAFAFPITTGGRVVGVMEFFSRKRREPEQALLPIMVLVGAQIGDFVERRRTEQSLRESEERFRLMTETAQDTIFTIDESSTVTFCNAAVRRMFGYEPEELLGKPLEMIMPERFREGHRRGVERFLRTGERSVPWTGIELAALHKDGHEFPCTISFGHWTTGERTIFTGFARDSSESARAREELQQALEHEQQASADAEAARFQLERRADEEAAFRHLASALTGAAEMSDVLYEITNRATKVTRADGVYVERVIESGGKLLVEVVSSFGPGAPARGLRIAYPGSMTEEIMREGAPIILADMAHLGKDMAPYLADSCHDCEVLITPLIAEEDALGALVLLNSGSSGRRFRDGDVVRARTLGDLASLALRRVRLMEREREAKERAEAAVRVRDETLGIVSHDLRNPLTKITLSADLMRELPAEEQHELIENIRASARQMERLIQDLLDVARMESGVLSVAQVVMTTESLLREVCDSHAQVAALKHQKITCLVNGELPTICADHDRLVQVFGNLIGNAIKFTPEGGSITVEATHKDSFVEFTVSDSGPGIPESELPNLFTPYWQSKKTAHLGSGLGLAIVRGIVEAHGGRVSAARGPAGGAAFSFTIPAVK